MKTNVSVKNVIKFAGAYIAFTIGSGFATGQEVMQFFTAFGPKGIIGALISMAIFSLMGAAVMMKGYELQLETQTEIFHYYCGKYLGRFLEYLTVAFLMCVVSIMIAGTGAIASEYFKISAEIGKLFMTILCVITVLLGLKKLVDIIGTIGPVITIFTILIGIITIASEGGINFDLSQADAKALLEVRSTAGWWFGKYAFLDTAWFSGILYAACMVLGGIPFLAGLGAGANSKKEAALGGILGGVFLMLAVIVIVIAMLLYPSEIVKLQVPNLFLAEKNTPALAFIFSIILIMGIYSTASPMFWLVLNRIEGFGINKKIMLVITIGLSILAYFGAQIGFGKLIGILYPFMGQIGFFMIIIVLVRPYIGKNNLENVKKS